ncbi:MAG: GNAT family N-acetyltransferase [Clostridia bacterium]|nr:GNAT family N-acetyltransferase [Clostridia bacterium]
MTPEERHACDILRSYGDPACYEEMIQTLVRGYAGWLDAGEGGVALYSRRADMYMLAGHSWARFEQMLSLVPPGASSILLHGTLDEATVERVRRRYGLRHAYRFVEYAYYGELPEEDRAFDIRPLGPQALDFVFANYGHASREYLHERLCDGVMLGAYVEGELAAFIGEHIEGSMGLLHVMPEYRRHHLGYALERAAIRRTMLLGQVPYDQVFEDNAASHALQKRLGMTPSAGRIHCLTDDAY